MKTLTLYMEKRDMEAVIRFLDNLRANGVMEVDSWCKIQINFWREAQKMEVNYEKNS